MNFKPILEEIRNFLTANADEGNVKKYSYYFKEGYDGYGVAQEPFYKFKDEFVAKYTPIMNIEESIELGNFLFASGKYEEGSLAILMLLSYKKEFSKETLNAPSFWLDNYVRNWAHTDFICGELMSVLLLNNHVSYIDLSEWRLAQSKWKRRAVPVSMIKLMKQSKDFGEFFNFIDPMMMDPERVVHQGLGWFLRECWKKKPEATEDFLLKWKNTSPRLIFQYATEKMTKENKERFRKEKPKKN
jgi:3-methyladenine DNA glycosylase AlkD